MAETGSRRGAASNTSLILAIVAFVAIGGLIYWLNATAVPTQVEYEPEDTAAAEGPVTDVPVVDLEQMRGEMAEFADIEIMMRGQSINSLLGEEAFWIGPEDNPFLVKMDSAALSATGSVDTGDTVDVRGTIRAMSDSVLNAWEEQGVISGEGERAVASFAEFFMSANEVSAGEAEEEGQESPEGEEGEGSQEDTPSQEGGAGG